MLFRSAYSDRKSYPEPTCSKVRIDYTYDSINHKLIAVGEINFYERIQSYHDSTLLSNRIKRYAMGDITALGTPRDPSDVNLVGVPSNLQEILNIKKSSVERFSQLPEELRKLFGNSAATFISCVQNGSIDAVLRDYINRGAGNKSGNSGNPGTEQGAPSSAPSVN